MIDELDRCRPSYAIELLEVAKHLFSVRWGNVRPGHKSFATFPFRKNAIWTKTSTLTDI